MKIVIVAPEVFPVPPVRGGAVETIIEEVSAHFKDHQVHILSIADPSLPPIEVKNNRQYHRWQQSFVDRLLLSSWKLPFKQSRSEWYYWPYRQWAAKKIRELQPNVIWAHSRIQFIPAFKKASPNSKVIFSLHNESNLKDSEVWTADAIESCDIVTSCSQSLANAAAAKYPSLKKRSRVLHNGVDLKTFVSLWEKKNQRDEQRKKNGLENKTVVVYAGRLVEEKGVHVLIEAFKTAAAKIPAAKLLIAGSHTFSDGTVTPYIENLKNAAKGWEDRIQFLGHVARPQLAQTFLAADILAFPSLWKEPFGMTLVEGMASGLAVAAFDQGGPSEILTHGTDGLLISGNSKEKLAQALEQLMNDATLRERLGRAARKTAEERFGWPKVAQEVIQFSKETLKTAQEKAVRVLIAESGSGYGGTAKYLAHLLRHLDREKFWVEVASYGDGPFMKEVEKCGANVFYPKSWKFNWGTPKSFLQMIFQPFSIAKQLRARKIEIVHLNNEILTHIPVLIGAKLAGCRVVCHLHGWRPFTRLEKVFVSFVDEFVSISQAGAQYFGELLQRKIHPVPNGLAIPSELKDLDEKRSQFRKKFGILDHEILIAIPGRLVEWKGQEVYLRALAQIIRKEPRLAGAILGHDPSDNQEYLKRLKALAAELGLEDRVRFLPFQEDIWGVYAGADVVIHASTKPEPFGLVILEAMLAAKPVIATRAGGVMDLVMHEETGILVEPGDADAMANAIARLSSEPQLAQRLGAAGAGRAKNVFTMEKNAAMIEEIYERLAQKS